MRVPTGQAVIDRLFAGLFKHDSSPLFRPRRLGRAAARRTWKGSDLILPRPRLGFRIKSPMLRPVGGI